MYCYNCGKQIDDDSKFCTYCGTPINQEASSTKEVIKETPKQEPIKQTPSDKPQKKLAVPIIIAIIAVPLILIAVIVFVVLNSNSIDLMEGTTVVFEGYDGYGSAYYIEDDSRKKDPKLLDIYLELTEEVSVACSINSDKCLKAEAKLSDYYDALNSVNVYYTTENDKPTDELSNGDTITYHIEYDEELFKKAGYKVKNSTKKYKVKGLESLEEINILQYADTKWEASNGSFYLAVIPKEGCPIDSIPSSVSEVDGNGDVTITIDGRELASEYGYKVSDANKSITVHVGNKPYFLDYISDDNRDAVYDQILKVLGEVYINKCGYLLYSDKVDETELIIVPNKNDITSVTLNSGGRIRAKINITTDKGHTYNKSINFTSYIDQNGEYQYSVDFDTSRLSCAIKGSNWPEFE